MCHQTVCFAQSDKGKDQSPAFFLFYIWSRTQASPLIERGCWLTDLFAACTTLPAGSLSPFGREVSLPSPEVVEDSGEG